MQNIHSVEFTDWHRAKRLAIFCGCAVVVFALGIWLFWAEVISLIVSFGLFYLLSPVVGYLEGKGLKRYYAIPLISAAAIVFTFLAFWFILPVLYNQIFQLASLTPQAIDNFYSNNLPALQEKINRVPLLKNFDLREFLGSQFSGEQVGLKFMTVVSGLWMNTTRILSSTIYILLIPAITIALLYEEPRIREQAWRLVPRDLVLPLRVFVVRMNRGFLDLGKGLATVAFVVGLLYMVGFSLVDLRFALLIGLIAGICRIIPYLDILVGAILSAVAIFADFQGWSQVVMVLGVFAIVFTIDGLLITPKIIGETVGLHPLFLIMSIIAFGYWWGIMGVLLAIPAVTFGKVIMRLILPFYYISPWYRPHFEEYRE